MRSVSFIATAALIFTSAAFASPTPAVEAAISEVFARHLTEKVHESAGNVARAYVWGCQSGRAPYCGAPGGGDMAAPGQTSIPNYTVVRQGCPNGNPGACCASSYTSNGQLVGQDCVTPNYTPPAPRTVPWTAGKPYFVCDLSKMAYCCQHDLGYAGTWNGCMTAGGGTYDSLRDERTFVGCYSGTKALCCTGVMSGAGNQVGDCSAAYSKE